jgi:hypothetical protein
MAGLTNAAKNIGIDAITAAATHISLHAGHPGTTGVNELSGGSYARQACAYDAAASGATQNAAQEQFTGLPEQTSSNPITHIGLWSAATAGTFYGSAPLGGAADVFTADAATDVFTAPSHGLADGNRVELEAPSGATLPAGVSVNTIYFVRDSTTNTFKLAATSGGAAIDITSNGSGVVRFINAKTCNAGDTFTIADGDLDIVFA